jgi:hypothetical protein
VLSNDIEVVADGPRDRVVIEGAGRSAIEITAERPVVRGLTLRVAASGVEAAVERHVRPSVPAVRISGGQPTLVDCDVSSAMGDGIDVRGVGSDPTITDCIVRDCASYGILVHELGKGRFARCEVTGNALAGMEVGAGGDPEVQACTFTRNEDYGVRIRASGCGTIRDCTLTGNLPTEWLIEPGALGTRRGNGPEAPR